MNGMARWGIWLWGRTRRPSWRGWERQVLSRAVHTTLTMQDRQIAVYQWGDGSKKVLLLPGWNSRASHFRNYIQPLMDHHFQVVGVDPIGHGHSTGDWTYLGDYLQTIEMIRDRLGPFDSVIGHSFGGFCIPFAMHKAHLADRAILLAAPPSLDWLFARFCNIMHITPLTRKRMLGEDCWQHYDVSTIAAKLGSTPTLILHDADDRAVPLEAAQNIHSRWPNASLLVTHHLGHQKVLRHAAAVDPVIAFIRGD